MDREVWEEFQRDWEKNAFEREAIINKLREKSVMSVDRLKEEEFTLQGLDKEGMVKQHVNQNFFRKAVLSAYDERCCITGLAIPQLLNASHIIPWAERAETRVNPANGLCLNALHDRAFDRGLISISEDYRVLVSEEVNRTVKDREAKRLILDFEGINVRLPERFQHESEFLRWHRENVFVGG